MVAPVRKDALYIVRQAMLNAGLLQPGNYPSSQALADYTSRLNDKFGVMQTQGQKLWLEEDLLVPLVQGQVLYTIGPGGNVDRVKPLRVKQGYYIEQSGTSRRPLGKDGTGLSRQEYKILSNPNEEGQIQEYYVDKQRDTLNVYFWLAPSAQAVLGEAHLIIHNQIDEVVNIKDVVDFPSEWSNALHWALAEEICTGQPEAITQRCERMAAKHVGMLQDWDVEDADTRFQPDQRMSLHSGEFQ